MWQLSSGEYDKIKVDILNSSEELERVSSPIYFKIIKNVVFIVARKIPKEVYGKEFKFSSLGRRNNIHT